MLLIIFIFVFLSCENGRDDTEIKPKRNNIIESVYASVNINPASSYQVKSIRPGTVENIYIQEGDLVEKEQKLFQIAATAIDKMQLSNAELNFEEAKSNFKGENSLIDNIQLEINSIEEQLSLDSINLERQERLLSQNIGKQIDYENLKLKYTSGLNQLELLNRKINQTKLTLEQNYKRALNQVGTQREQISDFKILSKIKGRVYSINIEEGDIISTQEKIAEIGSDEVFKIEMSIDEVDISKIDLRDSVLITLDAYPDTVFLAEISKISNKKNVITQTFEVESIFKNPPEKLYYGLSGEANIIVSIIENALVIPTSYLTSDNKVLTVDGERSVRVGVKNLEFSEILSGIDTSAVLFKPNE